VKFLASIVALSAVAFSQNTPPCNVIGAWQDSLLSVVRTINTAEVTYKLQYSNTNSFGTLQDLFNSGLIARYSELKASPDIIRLQESSDPLPGFQLDLLLSTDHEHYSLSVLKKSGDCSHIGLYSSDVGIIYRAKPIDYEEPATTAALKKD
jgi:hypothetical protein